MVRPFTFVVEQLDFLIPYYFVGTHTAVSIEFCNSAKQFGDKFSIVYALRVTVALVTTHVWVTRVRCDNPDLNFNEALTWNVATRSKAYTFYLCYPESHIVRHGCI